MKKIYLVVTRKFYDQVYSLNQLINWILVATFFFSPMRNIEKARVEIFEIDSVEQKEREKAATAWVMDRLREDQKNYKTLFETTMSKLKTQKE